MSKEFLKSYTGFSRDILEEFMTKKELRELDEKYNAAKFIRMLKTKELFDVMSKSPFVDKKKLIEFMLKELKINTKYYVKKTQKNK